MQKQQKEDTQYSDAKTKCVCDVRSQTYNMHAYMLSYVYSVRTQLGRLLVQTKRRR